MPEYKVLPAGDTALVVEFGERIDRQLSTWVLALAERLNAARLNGIIETVPTFRSLMVHYDPLALSAADLTDRIVELMRGLETAQVASRHRRLPACYDPQVAPDLEETASRLGMTPSQLVERHSGITFHVYMLGFLPGCAYLGDIPPGLSLPRRQTPRMRVPAGSVGIATTISIIYPFETPSGWHIIGRSPAPLWHRQPSPGALLAPGDQVTFTPISLREYEDLRAKAANGALTMVPSTEMLGVAA
jgi:KipI family sensor histidine kinase inhibitor